MWQTIKREEPYEQVWNAGTLTCRLVLSGAWVSCMQRTLKARMPRPVYKRSKEAKRSGAA